jgi:FtsZ-binding cell division protein ZapB
LATQKKGTFAFQRHQKKIKAFKIQVQDLQIEISNLKKENHALQNEIVAFKKENEK